ncbi:MAG TPA: mannosyltransferase family protein [Anaerolineae bacterium]
MKLDWRRALSFPVVVWLVSRAIILVWAFAVTQFLPVRDLHLVGDPPRAPGNGAEAWIEPWARWDTMWYLRIATHGYATNDLTAGFFPLYPLLIRALTFFIPNALLSALVVSNLAALGAFVVFYRLARDLFDEITARRALVYWATFPTAFYFFAGYAEALLVLFALLSIKAARTNRWWRAGWSGALATLARPPGFTILVPLAVEWLQARGNSFERLRRALPLALVPLGLGAHMLYLQLAFGDALLNLHVWQNVTVMPWEMPILTIKMMLAGASLPTNLMDLTFTLLVLGLTLYGWRCVPLSLTLYALFLILAQMIAFAPTQGFADIPMTGLARRVAVVFPAFFVLAQVWRGKFKEPLWVASSIALQLIFISIFVRWLWLD